VSIQGFYAGSTTGPLLAVPLLGPHISVYVYCGFVLCARLQHDTNSNFSPTDNDEPASKSSSGVDLGWPAQT